MTQQKIASFFIILIWFALPRLIFAEQSSYQVSFLGIPVVTVDITETKNVKTGQLQVVYHPKTADWIPDKYFVDNVYTFVLRNDYRGMSQYKKDIRQFNLVQSYEEVITDTTVVYSTGEVRNISQPMHHMLSLIVAIEYADSALTDPIILDLEGKYFSCRRHKETTDEFPGLISYEILMEPIGGEGVLDKTDYFNVELDNPSARRFISYSKHDGKIESARFLFGKISLSAKRLQ